jgi:hypothetical protein
MLSILLAGFVIVALIFFPVMLLARQLDTGKSDLVDCIIAVLVGSTIANFVVPFLPGANSDTVLQAIYSIGVVGVSYRYLLETTVVKGIVIALVPALGWALVDVVFPS